jgi:hypothetical protein
VPTSSPTSSTGGDTKDPGPDQFLVFDAYGHEVWQLQGADPEKPYVAPPGR